MQWMLAVLLVAQGCATVREEHGSAFISSPSADESRAQDGALRAEVEWALRQMWGVARGEEQVGARLEFTFWAEGGALTLLSWRQTTAGGATGQPADEETFANSLRALLTLLTERRTGALVFTLQREHGLWRVDYAASPVEEPPEARLWPTERTSYPAQTHSAVHTLAKQATRLLQVPAGASAHLRMDVMLEDDRLTGWAPGPYRATAGGTLRTAGAQATETLALALLPFTRGMGPRTVRLELVGTHEGRPRQTRASKHQQGVERVPSPARQPGHDRAGRTDGRPRRSTFQPLVRQGVRLRHVGCARYSRTGRSRGGLGAAQPPGEREVEMKAAATLPGLERLMKVCRKHGFPLETSIPEPTAPAAEEPFLGAPFDPILATTYRHLGGAVLGELVLYKPSPHEHGLARINEGMRRDEVEPFRSSLIFGQEPSLAYYYGTVPKLADAHGVQPVIYIDAHDQMFVLPIASSVECFFDLFSRYLEAVAEDPQYVNERHASISFPWDVPQLIARDEALIRMMDAHRFDFLLKNDDHTGRWLAQVQQVSRSLKS